MYPYMKFPIFTDFMFNHPDGVEGKSYNFSSDLEKIGREWDVSIQNGTGVDIISDPVTIDHSKYGIISLVKVKADVATDYHTIIKEFWVPINCIIGLKNNNESS
jgi:hypothetical protein